MKTAISVPDPIFKAADRLAKKLGISRSELYARAVALFVERHDERAVTAALDEVYGHEEARLDPTLKRAQARAVGPERW